MEELLKKLMESDVLTEDTVAKIKEAMDSKIEEAQKTASEETRSELSESYKKDMDRLVIALENMVREGLADELREFAEDKKALRSRIAEAAKAKVNAESKAKKELKGHITVLESFITESLRRELEEFSEDRRVGRKALARTLRESKARQERDVRNFTKKGAAVLETVVEGQLKGLLNELRDDIQASRQNDFGRRVFESFASEFKATFFNENKELSKVSESLNKAKSQVAKAKKIIESKDGEISELKKKSNRADEVRRRKQIKESLLSRLEGPARAEMEEILKDVSADKLQPTFRRFLSVVTESSSAKAGRGRKTLKESARRRNSAPAVRTGNRTVVVEQKDIGEDAEVQNMRRLAGLSK